MRTKNQRGGRVRLSKLPPKPSAMAFHFLGNQPSHSEAHPDCSRSGCPVYEGDNNSAHGKVPETSGDSADDRRGDAMATSTSGQRVDPEKFGGSGPQEIDGNDLSEMDWTEKKTCIKCDKGGKMLVCSYSGCPLAVHEKCMRTSAQFDDNGNFYCPYCLYKRAILSSRKARKKAMLAKKALSLFLDKERIDGDQQKGNGKKVVAEGPNPSTIAVDASQNVTQNQARNHFIPIEEGQHEERSDHECDTRILRCKGAETSSVNQRNDITMSKCKDNATIEASDRQNIVLVEKIHAEPIIVCGSGGVCCREEETGHEFEIAEVGKRLEPEHQREVDDAQQPEPLRASHVEEAPNEEIDISAEGRMNVEDILEDNEETMAEEEEMQEQEHEATDSFCGDTEILQTRKQKEQNVQHPQQVDRPRRSPRKSSLNQNVQQPQQVDLPRRSPRKSSLNLNSTAEDIERMPTTSTSRKVQEPSKRLKSPMYPSARRKKLPWTVEEEEMLEEGVQKFSTTTNKNLPWRKVLEFGRHVFEGTRTPVDLKDKWRNILAKKYSAN